jgi:putative phosphoribosyl transferase
MDLLFKDRTDAGNRLAKSLAEYQQSDALVLAVPRGGTPVAAAVARRLHLEWHVIPVHKLPIPWNPEAGFGAVTLDGVAVLNEPMVRALRMNQAQIREVTESMTAKLARDAELLYALRPAPSVTARCVIVVDDGLASGYTMLAAIKSLRGQQADKVVAAAPVASKTAADLVSNAADGCIIEVVSPTIPFAVADYYLRWHDLSEEEVMECFEPN